MMDALAADAEKLRQLTGEDHGPWCPACFGDGGAWRLALDVNAGPDGETGEFEMCAECGGTGKPAPKE